MKSDVSVVFLKTDVKKALKNSAIGAHCEVVALGPNKGSKKTSVILHRGFKAYSPTVERLTKANEVSSKAGTSCLVRFGGVQGADHLLFVGLGTDKKGVNVLGALERLRRLGASVASKLLAEKIKTAVVYFDSFLMAEAGLSINADDAAYAFNEGAGLAAYRFNKYISGQKDQKKKEEPLSLIFASTESSRLNAYKKGIERSEAMLTGAIICRDLSNEPSNELYPEAFARYAKKLATDYGLKCTILDEKAIERERMGLLYGVGQGSVKPPRLIVLEYNPSKKTKTLAFVGKGITFDSGGISIKPSGRMEDMKHDMSGAAAVTGAIVSAALLKLKTRIITVVAAAENMPSGSAIQPGNILKSRAGKTVEITNTDAEGRLVLADALDYTQDMKPDYIIDLATLTGAAGITLGKSCSGLMGNDDGFNRIVKAAAAQSGERVWELPLFEEYFDDLRSEFADMRNSGDTPSHGTAKAAMFLLEFIRKGTRWAHLDIASIAYNVPGISYYPRKTSTGYGVRLLIELAKKLG
ncbi:MAG: leucyl aminopeptidase [Bdellovibrionota bacterium]